MGPYLIYLESLRPQVFPHTADLDGEGLETPLSKAKLVQLHAFVLASELLGMKEQLPSLAFVSCPLWPRVQEPLVDCLLVGGDDMYLEVLGLVLGDGDHPGPLLWYLLRPSLLLLGWRFLYVEPRWPIWIMQPEAVFSGLVDGLVALVGLVHLLLNQCA